MNRRLHALVTSFGIMCAVVVAPAGATVPGGTARPAVDLVANAGQHGRPITVAAKPRAGGNADLEMSNRGTRAVRVRVTLKLPASWSARLLHPSRGESCTTTGHRFVCELPALSDRVERHVQLVVFMAKNVRYGAITSVPIYVAPIGARDADPKNNSAKLRVIDEGTADLSARITASATHVAKSATMKYTVVLTNHGPDPAVGITLYLKPITATKNGFTQLAPVGPGSCAAGSDGPVDAYAPYVCDLSRIASGRSVTYRITWRGDKRGAVGHLQLGYGESGYDAGSKPGGSGTRYAQVEAPKVTVTG